jgi:hydrogenase-4 membrane subunit HyfE
MWFASSECLAVSSQVFKALCVIFSNTTTCGNVKFCYVMLTNKMHFLNYCFNSTLLVFYMFRTSYVHHQEDYIVHGVVYLIKTLIKKYILLVNVILLYHNALHWNKR